MRGLTCIVPVQMIIPQAVKVNDNIDYFPVNCHIHEYYDSYLTDIEYTIPKDSVFSIDGVSYTHAEIYEWSDKHVKKLIDI